MIHFEFTLSSKKFPKNELLEKYDIEYLSDWLSSESDLKYIFYFGENQSDFEEDLFPDNKFLANSISLLRQNSILSDSEKSYILSIYTEDAYVHIKNGVAILHLILMSEYTKQIENEKIIKFLCNHIYNHTVDGILKYGILQPLTDQQKIDYQWTECFDWTIQFIEGKTYNIENLDLLHFSQYTYLYSENSSIKELSKPIYFSTYNLECLEISKLIDSVNNDILRYIKSIQFLKKKKKELKKQKNYLYKQYKNIYIEMLSEPNTYWTNQIDSIHEIRKTLISMSPKNVQ